MQGQQSIAASSTRTANSVSPGGHMFQLLSQVLSEIKKDDKSSVLGGAGSSLKSAILMKIIGAKALTGMGEGIKLIVEAVNSIQGSSKDFAEKMSSIMAGVESLSTLGMSILKFALGLALSVPLLIIGIPGAVMFGVAFFIVSSAFMLIDKLKITENIEKYTDVLKTIGIGILLFSVGLAATTLVTPLAIKGAFLFAMLFAIVAGVFVLFDMLKLDDKVKETSKSLAFASLAIISLSIAMVMSHMILSKMSGGDVLLGVLKIMGVVVGVGIAFAIIGKFAGSIFKGSLVMLIAAIPLIVIGYAFKTFAKSVTPDKSGWVTIAQVSAVVLGIGVLMAAAGAIAPLILVGAAALILSGAALVTIGFGIEKLAGTFKKSSILLEDSGQVTPGLFGIGGGRPMSNMEALILTLAQSFSLRPDRIAAMMISAPALILVSTALMSIGDGIKKFQGLSIDYGVLPKNIAMLITSVTEPFVVFGKGAGAGGGSSLMSKIFGGGDKGSPLHQGISSTIGISRALSSIASGTQSMVNLKFPIYKGTEIVGYNTLQSGFEVTLGDNIRSMINAVVTPFVEFGTGAGSGGRASLMNRVFGGGSGGSALSQGISSVLGISSALTGIAKGTQSMADLKFPIYEGTEIVGYETLSPDFNNRLKMNVLSIINAMVAPFAEFGANGGAGGGNGWFSNGSPIAQGISSVAGIGNAISGIASGAQAMASLKFPIYGTGGDGTKIIGYKVLKPADFVAIGNNLKSLILSMTDAFSALGGSSAADSSWFSSNDYEKGLKIAMNISDPIIKIAETAKIFANSKFDAKAVGDKIQGVILAMTSAFQDVGRSGDVTANLTKGLTLTAESLSRIGNEVDAFGEFATAYESYVSAFSDHNILINEFDVEKQSLIVSGHSSSSVGKLNNLFSSESIKNLGAGSLSLSELTKSYDKFTNATKKINIKGVEASTNMFKSLADLAEANGNDVMTTMAEKLMQAVNELGEVVLNLEEAVGMQSNASKEDSNLFLSAINKFSGFITDSNNQVKENVAAASSAGRQKVEVTNLKPLIIAMNEIEERLNMPLVVDIDDSTAF